MGCRAPVIQNQHLNSGELCQQLQIAAVPLRQDQFLQESASLCVLRAVPGVALEFAQEPALRNLGQVLLEAVRIA